MADRPRTFAEVVAAEDPAERERRERGDTFKNAGVENGFHADVDVQEDREHPGEWRVEYSDDDGGCYVTLFAGPEAERRARDYSAPAIRKGQDRSRRRDRALKKRAGQQVGPAGGEKVPRA